MNFGTRSEVGPAGFQMAPMIDVVFLMLCFAVASQLYARWETEIDISLPTAETGEAPRRLPGEIVLNINTAGDIIFNGRLLSREQLEELLERIVRDFPNQPILIRADGETAYRNVVTVLDMCRRSDLWNISFATGAPETSSEFGTRNLE